MSLQTYLNNHYQTLEQFAESCAVSTEYLNLLLDQRQIPAPSYTVISDSKCISQAFGELTGHALECGKYFHPGNKSWVVRGSKSREEVGAKQAPAALKRLFKQNFANELQALDRNLFRLQDSFTASGDTIAQGLAKRTDTAWELFLKGVFSLCVANPSSEKSIATKEVLQEALITLTDNGQKIKYNSAEKNRVLSLIDQYEQAAMPFSPLEYPISSRKRLVEELRAQLA